jgi:hypothetical protein
MACPANEPEEPTGGEGSPPPEVQDLDGHQDTFRKVYFGQISDPLIPEPRHPEGTPEDELTRAALSDPDALMGEVADDRPTTWRWVFLLMLAVAALATVFWKH